MNSFLLDIIDTFGGQITPCCLTCLLKSQLFIGYNL